MEKSLRKGTNGQDASRDAPRHVCGVYFCVIVELDSVLDNATPSSQSYHSRDRMDLEQVLRNECI